jgi:hypothetical protein
MARLGPSRRSVLTVDLGVRHPASKGVARPEWRVHDTESTRI